MTEQEIKSYKNIEDVNIDIIRIREDYIGAKLNNKFDKKDDEDNDFSD